VEKEQFNSSGAGGIIKLNGAAPASELAKPMCPMSGQSARPSSGDGAIKGQIVGRSNGEGRGAICRAIKPNEKT